MGPPQELMGPGGRCDGAGLVSPQPICPLCDVPSTVALAQQLSVVRDHGHDAALKKIISSKDKTFNFPLFLFWGWIHPCSQKEFG